jgi:hypothetical protein
MARYEESLRIQREAQERREAGERAVELRPRYEQALREIADGCENPAIVARVALGAI